MTKETITRKDGITYTRKKRSNNLKCMISFRYEKDKIEKLKEIAKNKDTDYSLIIRKLIDNYIKKEAKNEDSK